MSIEISYATMQTASGLMMIGATDRGLCFLEFGRSEAELLQSLRREFAAAELRAMPHPPPEHCLAWMHGLRGYLDCGKALGTLPAVFYGTAFQRKVWSYLQTIPHGSVQTYSEVAAGIGQPKAVRAVASACASNRIALVVPCHRVIRGMEVWAASAGDLTASELSWTRSDEQGNSQAESRWQGPARQGELSEIPLLSPPRNPRANSI